jgi:hypothetical protein
MFSSDAEQVHSLFLSKYSMFSFSCDIIQLTLVNHEKRFGDKKRTASMLESCIIPRPNLTLLVTKSTLNVDNSRLCYFRFIKW